MEESVRDRVVRAIQAAEKSGSPVADDAEATAEIALRRYRSRDRRKVKDTRAAIAQDLAKGLIADFERYPELVGPLKADYLHLAEVIIDVLESHPPTSGTSG
jgi:hypothetical protein